MRASIIAAASLLLAQASALHFYFEGDTTKCFIEELPKDTLVVGTSHFSVTYHNLPQN